MIEINGMAHVTLTVGDWDRCRPFYVRLLTFLGLKQVYGGDEFVYFVGGRTAVGIHRCDPARSGERFVQGSVGLHHMCFRCRSREDVDRVHEFLLGETCTIVRAPESGPWAPGYYSVLFEDPAGIRLEVNHVPGRGVLAEDTGFDPAADYR